MTMFKLPVTGINKKIMLTFAAAIFLTAFVLLINFISDYRETAFDGLIKKAESFTSVADETKNHVARLHAQNVFDYDTLLAEVKSVVAQNGDYTQTKFFKTIPIVAGWTAAEEAAKKANIEAI